MHMALINPEYGMPEAKSYYEHMIAKQEIRDLLRLIRRLGRVKDKSSVNGDYKVYAEELRNRTASRLGKKTEETGPTKEEPVPAKCTWSEWAKSLGPTVKKDKEDQIPQGPDWV